MQTFIEENDTCHSTPDGLVNRSSSFQKALLRLQICILEHKQGPEITFMARRSNRTRQQMRMPSATV